MIDSIHSKVKDKLTQVAIEAFHSTDRDHLTVKSVRNKVEEDLELERGFLRSEEWKKESKVIIEKIVQELLDAEEEEEQELQQQDDDRDTSGESTPVSEAHSMIAIKSKLVTKKRSLQNMKDAAGRRKRQKIKPMTSCGEQRIDNTLRRFSSQENEENSSKDDGSVKLNTKRRKLIKRSSNYGAELNSADSKKEEQQKKKFDESEGILQQSEPDDIISFRLDSAAGKTFSRAKAIEIQIGSDSESLRQNRTEVALSSHAAAIHDDFVAEKESNVPQGGGGEASDSEMSVLIDEVLQKPTRRKQKGQEKERTAVKTGGKVDKRRTNESPRSSLPQKEKKTISDGDTLKKLQSQLRKCGVRTLWHFELKEYGDDTRAKIRHLQKALKDIGMHGRFSEARARDIKESRELMADLEAVKEGDMKWGLNINLIDDLKDEDQNEKLAAGNKDDDSKYESGDVNEDLNQTTSRKKLLLRGKPMASTNQRRQRSTALDWLGDEESSDG